MVASLWKMIDKILTWPNERRYARNAKAAAVRDTGKGANIGKIVPGYLVKVS